MWKVIRQAARSRWFTQKQWKIEPTHIAQTEDISLKAVSIHYNLCQRDINSSDVPKDSFGNDHANSNKRKKSSYRDEYGFFKINPSFLEAVSWLGTSFVLAINLKLKISSFHRNLCYQYEDHVQENYPNHCVRHGLRTTFSHLWSLVFSMPNTKRTVLPNTSRNETSNPFTTTSDKEESEHLSPEKGYDEMKMASVKYIGHIENMIGLQLLLKDPIHAFHHFKAAGDLGCSKANFNLGLCYELGKGTEQNLHKAVHYYQLAASDGHGFAMYNLGIYYIDGLGGLQKDDSMGLQLIEKAAELGIPEFADSQYYLGLCYENGWGVDIDYVEAVKHFSSAADSGHTEAKVSVQNYLDKGNMKVPDNHLDVRNNETNQETNHISKKEQILEFKQAGTNKNKEHQNTAASIHPSSSSPELSRMGSPVLSHPLTNFDLASYLNMNFHMLKKVDKKRFLFDSDTVSLLDEDLSHWASSPSLTVT